MLNIVRDALQLIIDDIDSGNSNISQEQLLLILDILNHKELNRTEAAEYIGKSVSSFDNYIKKGLIPEGIKKRGLGKIWYKSDLDNFLNYK